MTPSEREPAAESRTGMTPMDTTREALWLAYWENRNTTWVTPHRDTFDAGWAAGVAEVERRYAELVEAIDELSLADAAIARYDIDGAILHRKRVDEAWAKVGRARAALASIDGAP